MVEMSGAGTYIFDRRPPATSVRRNWLSERLSAIDPSKIFLAAQV